VEISSLFVASQPDRSLGIARIGAVQQVRRMRGGSQAHLMRCSDQNFYVVKFLNNPQHMRVLANEMLGCLLARIAGLPVPEPVLVEVSEGLIQCTPELNIQLVSGTIPCPPGLQFGSRYAVPPLEGQVFDHLPAAMLGRVRNLETFAGILAMDKWTCNSDKRQAAFWRLMRQRNYAATFIDQGNCFNGAGWNFPDATLSGVYRQNEVYANVLGWDSFEPWLSRIEDMGLNAISEAAEEIPPAWYGGDCCALAALVRMLLERRTLIRRLLTAFRLSSGRPFPNWGERSEPEPEIVA
jgi:HipA-like protein